MHRKMKWWWSLERILAFVFAFISADKKSGVLDVSELAVKLIFILVSSLSHKSNTTWAMIRLVEVLLLCYFERIINYKTVYENQLNNTLSCRIQIASWNKYWYMNMYCNYHWINRNKLWLINWNIANWLVVCIFLNSLLVDKTHHHLQPMQLRTIILMNCNLINIHNSTKLHQQLSL